MSETHRARSLDGRAVLVVRSRSPVGGAAIARFVSAGARVHAAGDIRSGEERQEAVGGCLEAAGGLDVLVVPPAPPMREPPDSEEAAYREMVDAGLRAVYFVVQEAARAMPGGGRICVAASPRPASTPDSMTAPATLVEGGTIALTSLLAVELAPAGIAVNALCPIGAGADAAEAAAVMLFLCSPEASYVTGACLPVT